MSLNVFFSHAWADKEFRELKFLLNNLKRNYNVWIDKKQIEFGDAIDNELMDGIRNSDVVLVAWSKNAAASKAVRFELSTAQELGKRIVPCRLDDHPLDAHPALVGTRFFTLAGDSFSDESEWVLLNNFLLTLQSNTFPDGAETSGIKQQLNALDDVLVELQDLIFRYGKGVSGNDASHEYIKGAVNEFLKLFGGETDSKMYRFTEAMNAISEAYPDQKDDARKQQLMLKAIRTIDPEGTESELQGLAAYLVASGVEESAGVAVAEQSIEVDTPVASVHETVSFADHPAFDRLKNRQLLYLKSNSWGSGDSYSSSRHSRQIQLSESGQCYFLEIESNYSSITGTVPSHNELTGRWELLQKNGSDYICFHWDTIPLEELEMQLSPTVDEVTIGGILFGIVDFDRRI